MGKILYALLITVLFVGGVASVIYGLYIFWPPLAYVIGGLFIAFVALVLNQAYDNEGGDK